MKHIIRVAGPDDLYGITNVFSEVSRDQNVSMATSAEMLSRVDAIGEYLKSYQDTDFVWHAIVVIKDEKVVGVCDILRAPLYRTRHVAELGIGLLPEYRGMGMGRALMDYAFDWMRKNGITKTRLFVLEGNDIAGFFYKDLGFTEVGVYKNEVSTDNGFIDLLIMEKIL